MEYGRGAWTQRGKDNGTSYYALMKDDERYPRDGSLNYPAGASNEEISWYVAVNAAVNALQTELHGMGLMDLEDVNGIFGKKTKNAVKEYQSSQGLISDGLVGARTMEKILHPVMVEHSNEENVNPKWLYGLARQESALDPGAQGWETPDDLGVWQHNTSLSVTPEEAFEIQHACKAAVARWVKARAKFSGKGADLRVDCCIIQHRSPSAAEFLYANETPLGPESDQYVKNVRAFAEQF